MSAPGGAPYPPPPRGVWLMPFKSVEGHELVAAIASGGRLVAMLPLPTGRMSAAVEGALWSLLDAEDPAPPRPRLAVAEGGGAKARGARKRTARLRAEP